MPERWNDQAIDGLKGRVDRHDAAIEILDEALYREAARDAKVDAIRETQDDERELATEERNVNRRFRKEVRENFAQIRNGQSAAAGVAAGTDWKSVLTYFIATTGGVGIPLAVILIAKG